MLSKMIDGLLKPFVQPIVNYHQVKTDNKIADNLLSQGSSKDESETETVIFKTTNKYIFRPTTFDEYVGQEKKKVLLKAYIAGVKARSLVFPHMIIAGPAGCGKTTLARLIASELKVKFTEIISSNIENIWQLRLPIQSAEGGIVFIDEVHRIEPKMAEGIYSLMEDFSIDGSEVEPFTLIGATTELGMIKSKMLPFFERFKIPIQLEDYTLSDIQVMLKQYAKNVFPESKLSTADFRKISENARLTPRRAIKLFEASVYLNNDIPLTLSSFDILYKGYTKIDKAYLEVLAINRTGAGLTTLTSYLQTSKDNIQYDIEPYLLRNKAILKAGNRGRVITDIGLGLLSKLREFDG